MDKLITDINFISKSQNTENKEFSTTTTIDTGKSKKLYIESYGCAMNFSDSEIVSSILAKEGYDTTSNIKEADLIFLNTCSIREKAEQTIRNRLSQIKKQKRENKNLKIGVLGCMAERLKETLLEEEKMVDIVVGPDAYRSLPELIKDTDDNQKAVNVILSLEETYGDITPIRLNTNGVSAFISITRGCDNMCAFCVVPFTRGRERSRNPESIVNEAKDLVAKGYKEVTLLGQNVDSYLWYGGGAKKDFKNLSEEEQKNAVTFAQLLEIVAQVSPKLRVRFSTSHPKDIDDQVLYTIKKYDNICKNIHLPVQSGNSRVLKLMNRTYDRDWYISKVDKIRSILGEDCGITSDMIAGFCSETEEEHQDTLSIMKYTQYDFSYMFFYSERPGTLAHKKYEDDIPLEIKKRRLQEIIDLQSKISNDRNLLDIGKKHIVLVDGISKKDPNKIKGRNDQNKVVVFSKQDFQIGDYVEVLVESCTSGTLFGTPIKKLY